MCDVFLIRYIADVKDILTHTCGMVCITNITENGPSHRLYSSANDRFFPHLQVISSGTDLNCDFG